MFTPLPKAVPTEGWFSAASWLALFGVASADFQTQYDAAKAEVESQNVKFNGAKFAREIRKKKKKTRAAYKLTT